MITWTIFLSLTYFNEPNICQIHSCCCKGQNFILFYGWAVFHYIYTYMYVYTYICIYIHSRAYTHIALLSIFQASYMIYKVYYSKTVKKNEILCENVMFQDKLQKKFYLERIYLSWISLLRSTYPNTSNIFISFKLSKWNRALKRQLNLLKMNVSDRHSTVISFHHPSSIFLLILYNALRFDPFNLSFAQISFPNVFRYFWQPFF